MANTPSRRRPHTRAVSDPSSPRTLSPPDLAAARSQPEDYGEQRRRRASQPHQQQQHPRQPPGGSLLQPRLAVVLNVPPPWHPWLFALRLASVLPALWWGLPSILHLIILVLSTLLVMTSVGGRHEDIVKAAESEGGVTEATLASIWVWRAFLFRETVVVYAYKGLMMNQPAVFCVGVPVLLLHRLPHVEMVKGPQQVLYGYIGHAG